MNIKDTLTQEDMRRWAINLFIFSAPAIAIFFVSFSTGNFLFAWGAFAQAIAAAILDLHAKYKAGVDVRDFPSGTKTIIESNEEALEIEKQPLEGKTEVETIKKEDLK